MSLTGRDVAHVAGVVRRGAAIVLDSDKGYLIEARLGTLTKLTGHASVPDLVQELRASDWSGLHEQVVEVLTTNETSFFRDAHPWRCLESAILPPLLALRRRTRRLTVWSGACSSGQEAYSLAILLRERFPALADWRITNLCTDISPQRVGR